MTGKGKRQSAIYGLATRLMVSVTLSSIIGIIKGIVTTDDRRPNTTIKHVNLDQILENFVVIFRNFV
jgi:hypothetical protein